MHNSKKTVKVLKSVRNDLVMDNFGRKNIEYLSNGLNFKEDKHFTMIEKSCVGDDVQPNTQGVKKTAKMLLRRRSIGE